MEREKKYRKRRSGERRHKKRILFVVSTLGTGGAQRAFANMSLGFPDDWQCDFLLNDDSDVAYPHRGQIISLGLKPQKDKTSLRYQLAVLWKRFWKLRKLKSSGRYTVCISALTSANAVNVLTGNRYCRTIVSVRVHMSKIIASEGYKGRIEYWLTRCLSNGADFVVSVSESARLDLIRNFHVKEDRTATIYNGYLPEQMRDQAKEALLPEERLWFQEGSRHLVTVGRLDIQKGQFHLIRAFAKVHRTCPDTRLLILGTGKLEEKLKQLITGLHLEQAVILCGFVNNPYKILKESDIFVLSSLFEGFPNTLAESLCLGIPAVSTDCDSGAREILAPETDIEEKVQAGFEQARYGVLCPVCDGIYRNAEEGLTAEEEALADAVLFLLQDKEAYAHYKGRCGIRARQLSIQQSVQKWMELINE